MHLECTTGNLFSTHQCNNGNGFTKVDVLSLNCFARIDFSVLYRIDRRNLRCEMRSPFQTSTI